MVEVQKSHTWMVTLVYYDSIDVTIIIKLSVCVCVLKSNNFPKVSFEFVLVVRSIP